MIAGKTDRKRIENDAEAIKDKFGPFAEVYADNRSDAAELAGDDAAGEHWKKVGETLDEDG